MVRRILFAAALLALPAGAALAAPPGSYRGSCSDINQSGPTLSATCRDRNGVGVETSLDLRACRGQPVANSNGRLTCGGAAGGVARPRNDDYGDAGPPRPYRQPQGYGYPPPPGYGGPPRPQPGYGYGGPPPPPPGYGDDDN